MSWLMRLRVGPSMPLQAVGATKVAFLVHTGTILRHSRFSALVCPIGRCRNSLSSIGHALAQLEFNFRLEILGRLITERSFPLERRLEFTSNAPVGVPKVIIDRRVGGLEFNGAFKFADRIIILAQPEMRPSQ